jgi:hypothetical protein
MAASPTEWLPQAAAPGSRPSAPDSFSAAVLAQALRLGIRYFETEIRSGPVPPEVHAMRGALQQYERSLREAEDAREVLRRTCRKCGQPFSGFPCGPTHALMATREVRP